MKEIRSTFLQAYLLLFTHGVGILASDSLRGRANNQDSTSLDVSSNVIATNIALDERKLIIGGNVARPGNYPYFGTISSSFCRWKFFRSRYLIGRYSISRLSPIFSIYLPTVHFDGIACGGTLIAPDIVLTAGHVSYLQTSNSLSVENKVFMKSLIFFSLSLPIHSVNYRLRDHMELYT